MCRSKRWGGRGARYGRVLLLLAGAGALCPAWSQDEEPRFSAVVGAVARLNADYSGSSERSTSLRPMFAIRYGRFRIASSGASAVLAFGGEPQVAGASADIIATDDLKIGAALRADEGRSASDSPDLAGLPDVRATLRGRFYATMRLTPNWSAGVSVSQDLLGREGGALAALDIGYTWHLSERTQWSIGAGVGAGDQRYMRTWYGISQESAATAGRAAYEPGAGLRDVSVGTRLITAITPQWIAFANAGWSSLQGPAAKSPLTRERSGASFSVGLGYRWKN